MSPFFYMPIVKKSAQEQKKSEEIFRADAENCTEMRNFFAPRGKGIRREKGGKERGRRKKEAGGAKKIFF